MYERLNFVGRVVFYQTLTILHVTSSGCTDWEVLRVLEPKRLKATRLARTQAVVCVSIP